MLSNLLTFSHTQQPITTIFYTHGKMGVNEWFQRKQAQAATPTDAGNTPQNLVSFNASRLKRQLW